MANSYIKIRGAREHNLKNINVDIPRDKLVIITGLSGSGKSSLAFDTIYAEGQRRYVESLSSYARQFLGQMDKPDLDLIEGLSPAISIEQKTTHRNPRSTVGTVTEIYDYLRLLFARVGTAHCPQCQAAIRPLTVDEILDRVTGLPDGAKLILMAPIVTGRKGEHKEILEEARKEGFTRVRINGEIISLEEEIQLSKKKKSSIDIVVDRIVLKSGIRTRLSDSLEIALKLSGGIVIVNDLSQDHIFSQKFACPNGHEQQLSELEPRIFSFNSPMGACPSCDGIGSLLEFDENLLLSNPDAPLIEGCFEVWGKSGGYWYVATVHALAKSLNFDIQTPWSKLPRKTQKIILYGDRNIKIEYDFRKEDSRFEFSREFEGVIPNLQRRYKETKSDSMRQWMEGFMTTQACPTCSGKRLKPTSLAVRIKDISINEFTAMPVSTSLEFVKNLELPGSKAVIARPILKEIKERLGFLNNVGLNYLTLDRNAGTLSGGEAQRIRLATQIGSGLMGVLYILDEPSIGLHQRDNTRLIATLKNLKKLGNTVLVIEHDEETMRASDYIIDMGPGAGVHGGGIVAKGTPTQIMRDKKSVTGKYLSGKLKIPIPDKRREGNGKSLKIIQANENNLKNIDLEIPLGKMVIITGVSGSGKSTAVNEILYKALAHKVMRTRVVAGKHKKIIGIEAIDKVINIDQSPIGRTPRSNPATYTGLFTPIRELFSNLEEAKIRGYLPGRFSFNVSGGRCENCQGDGIIKIEMHFLPDVYVVCDICHGKRYNRETLEVKYKGKSIFDVLDMTVEDALIFFENIPSVRNRLKTLVEVGLDYIKLGQAATTFSGGEAQRIKLATELSKRSTGKTLYILDEPTTGLHFDDVKKLLTVLNTLVDKGNSMVIIEHNLDVIKSGDYIIDMGPEGGDAGGQIVTCGTPEQVSKHKTSQTGLYLKNVL